MSIELSLAIAAAVIVGLFLVAKFFLKARPKEKYFKCARCGARAPHSDRTIEAWRNRKTKFFCQTCHRKWLERQPPQVRQQSASVGRASSSGCLGAALLLLVTPGVLIYALWHIYA